MPKVINHISNPFWIIIIGRGMDRDEEEWMVGGGTCRMDYLKLPNGRGGSSVQASLKKSSDDSLDLLFFLLRLHLRLIAQQRNVTNK